MARWPECNKETKDMDIFNVLSLLGGLAMFLYGMNVMGDGLAKTAGGKLEKILEKLTSTPIRGVLLGAAVTGVIQSSSATTVMVVGLVNSGIMKLRQAVGIIMGANIGTTVTSWILSLTGIQSDNIFINMLKPSSFSPILAVIGIIFLMFTKSEKKHDIGAILLGFTVLMFGMEMMSGAVEPLKDVPQFTQILTKFENPLLGVIAGFVLTTIMQSSSVSVGILQALCSTGAVSYALALPIIMGQNIGSCTTAMISSVGASKDAKRAAAVHFYFNVIGTVVFMLVFYISNAFVHYAFLPQAANEVGIATIHSIFNIAATIVLLPLSGFLEFLAVKTIKDDDEEEDELSKHDKVLQLLDPVFLERPGFAIMQCRKVASEMAELSMKSVGRAVGLLTAYDEEIAERIRKEEDTVDKYEDQLGTYLLRLSTKDLSKEDGHRLSLMLHSLGDIERISDLAVNILLAVEQMHKKELIFSKKAMDELAVYSKALKDILTMTVNAFEQNDRYKAALVQPLEELMDDMNKELKKRHVKRLRKGKCTIELGLSLSDISDTYERISDHCSNIATCVIQVEDDELDAHEHRKEVKEQDAKWYDEQYRAYEQKYALP